MTTIAIMFVTIMICNSLFIGCWVSSGHYQRQVVGLDRLEMAINSRCKRFSFDGRDSKSNNISSPLALIHIPKGGKNYHINRASQANTSSHILCSFCPSKAGGNSVQDFLLEEAVKSGISTRKTRFCKNLCSGKKNEGTKMKCFQNSQPTFVWPTSVQLPEVNDCVSKIVNQASLLIGHQDFHYVENVLNWQNKTSSWMTIFRNPINRDESSYRWDIQQGRTKVDVHNKSAYQEGFDKWVSSMKTRMSMQPFTMHVPFVDEEWGNNMPCGHDAACSLSKHIDNSSGVPHGELTSNLIHHEHLEEIAIHIAQRFSVVMVMEHIDTSLAIARCRIPWIQGNKLPHSNPTKKFPHELVRNETLMAKKVAQEKYLYDVAIKILRADAICCSIL